MLNEVLKYAFTGNALMKEFPFFCGMIFLSFLYGAYYVSRKNFVVIPKDPYNEDKILVKIPETLTVFTFAESLFILIVFGLIQDFHKNIANSVPETLSVTCTLAYCLLLFALAYFVILSSYQLTFLLRNNIVSIQESFLKRIYLSIRVLVAVMSTLNIVIIGYILLFY